MMLESIMPKLASSDYYIKPLETLLSDLTPAQRKELAGWINLLAHYGRELTVKAQIAEQIGKLLLNELALPDEANQVKHLVSALETVDTSASDLKELFDDLDRAVLEYR